MMNTNIVESLNKCMMKARRLPITSAHEFLRHMLQKWFSDRRATADRIVTEITSAALAHVNFAHSKTLDRGCSVVPIIHGNKFLVKHAKEGDGIVNIDAKTCSCRKWDLDQLSCLHAVAAGSFMRVHYNSFCHPYYTASWVKKAYELPINPVPNKSAWVIAAHVRRVVVHPLVQRRQPGRPREGRIPSSGEARQRKKCGKCGAQGHNRLSCPNEWSSSIGESSTAATTIESRDAAVATARANRKCSICKEAGHTRRRCPIQLSNQGDDNFGNDLNNQ
ncbi:uncharacterized protein LOC127794754 [Diospyros lotus]|uniref:uncharacterized protein LOC127794754 n=1 Tax=Diospyros lotus TaxID=55363 RepID=UPI00225B17E4|nr:uncharacterized protein LOC127794754 [Diospyros lotus]